MAKGTHTIRNIKDLSPGSSAFFLDFDGTLADIAPQPDQVRVDPDLVQTLQRLQNACQGAVAIISGRSVATIDDFLKPLKAAVAGIHGAEFRLADGTLERTVSSDETLQLAKGEAREFADAHPGVLFEDKDISFSLHYRQADQYEKQVSDFMQHLVETLAPDFELQRGKKVFEVKPKGCHKGEAISRFMQQAPFQGKTPVYLGDDVTDEDGFRTVNAMNGLSVKIGEGETCARERLESPAAVQQWLAQLLSREPTPATTTPTRENKNTGRVFS